MAPRITVISARNLDGTVRQLGLVGALRSAETIEFNGRRYTRVTSCLFQEVEP